MDVPIAPNKASPPAEHKAVPANEIDKYPKDRNVSGVKQSSGIAFRISPGFGKSCGVSESALPFKPYDDGIKKE